MHKDSKLAHLYTRVFDDRAEALEAFAKGLQEIIQNAIGNEDLEPGWIWADQQVPEHHQELTFPEESLHEFDKIEDKWYHEFSKLMDEAFAIASARIAAEYIGITKSYEEGGSADDNRTKSLQG